MKRILVAVLLCLLSGSFWYKESISEALILRPEIASKTPEPEDAKIVRPPSKATHTAEMKSVTENGSPSRPALLKEYWTSLLSHSDSNYGPNHKLDEFTEIKRILSLDFRSSLEYFAALDAFPPEAIDRLYPYSEFLLTNIADKDPKRAISLILESEFSYDRYAPETAVRIWMDQEGLGIMDWFEENDIMSLSPHLGEAFLSVYAEEDPFQFLLQYGDKIENDYLVNNSLENLYHAYGPDAYDFLKSEVSDPERLDSYFYEIGQSLIQNDINHSKDWISKNRFTADPTVVADLTEDYLMLSISERGPSLAVDDINWAITNNLMTLDDYDLQLVVGRLSRHDPQIADQFVRDLQSRYGEDSKPYSRFLQKTEPEDEEIFHLNVFEVESDDGYLASHTISGYSPRVSLEDIGARITVLTQEFLNDIDP